MTYKRTYNYELARSIMTHSARMYRAISDDYSPGINDFRPFEHESLWYVIVSSDDGELLGLFLFVPQNFICLEVHTCLLPNAFGRAAKEAGRGVAKWMWGNSLAHRLVTSIPESNRLAVKFAMDCGMRQYGRNEKAILKGGKLQDLLLFGISRPLEFAVNPSPAAVDGILRDAGYVAPDLA